MLPKENLKKKKYKMAADCSEIKVTLTNNEVSLRRMCNTVEGCWWSGRVAATHTAAWSDVPEDHTERKH